MCKSYRRARELSTSADRVAFIERQVSWRQAYRAGWFDDWGRNVPTARERRERQRIEQGRV